MIHIIKRLNFDMHENSIGKVISEEIVGYVDSLEEAREQMKKLREECVTYSKFFSIPIDKLG
jgi:hypothetical protein